MIQKNPILPALIRRALCAWLGAATLEYLLLPAGLRSLEGTEALKHMSLLRLALVGAGLFLALCLAGLLLNRSGGKAVPSKGRLLLARLSLPLVFAVCAGLALAASFIWGMLGGCAFLLLLLMIYALRGWDNSPETGAPLPAEKKPRPVWALLTGLAALGFFAGISLWGIARVQTLNSTTYDFGIFSQMFAYMRRTGLPLTTLERDGLLSHFKVHISPIYYLMLPFYWLVPRPETLNVLQAAVMASAVIPLWKLGGVHGLTGPRRFLLCVLLLAAPAFAAGANGDLHENCFLTPLLLWLLLALDRDSRWGTALSALLVLCVKEDAAVYVAVAGLFVLLRAALRPERRRQLLTGLLLLGGSVLCFVLETSWLNRVGDGAMSWRYRNLFYTEEGNLLSLVAAVLLCPIKAVYECLEPEKLPYLALTLGVLLGMPLWTRRYERLLLLIPLVLINLLSDYRYQHEIHYQYNYGTLALLFYLSCVNLASLPERKETRLPLRAAALALAILLSAGCLWKEMGTRWKKTLYVWMQGTERWAQTRALLDRIPSDAAVTAHKIFTVPLSDLPVLYDLYHADKEHILGSDYVVIPWNENGENNPENLDTLLTENGFRVLAELPDNLRLYEKQPR